MARIRTIKPAFFSSLSNAELPKTTRLTWIGLWTYVDDSARGVDDPRLVKAAIWPLDDDYPTKKVEADLVLLAKAGKIERYTVDDRRYLRVIEWHHQRINRPVDSVLPASPTEVSAQDAPPPDDEPPQDQSSEDAVSPPCGDSEDSPPEGKGVGREGNGGGVGGEGNAPSSSSNRDPVGRPAADDDEGSTPISTALALIADRRIAAAVAEGLKLMNPGGYRRQTLRGVNGEFGDEVERMLRDGMTPEAVADALVPVRAVVKRYPDLSSERDGEWAEETDDDGNLLAARWVPRSVGA
jgi:hypothetical protein